MIHNARAIIINICYLLSSARILALYFRFYQILVVSKYGTNSLYIDPQLSPPLLKFKQFYQALEAFYIGKCCQYVYFSLPWHNGLEWHFNSIQYISVVSQGVEIRILMRWLRISKQ